ncbi:hypothetical protein L226DRAFT_534303 [Lentinus tigrinus ALCF2SS1-7]|uniref:uncharacterized protein n=1 Tax=Lentinus tigrinus ALCF2SS1-7 TaxID=1328758 RepID=UPI00116607B4|nr:hypothetical protein L226DRAFT_534303 [Lentinus tigrinus ALCF2SS1-7]
MTEPNITSGELNIATGELIGLWLQLFVTGAYLMYLPRCAIALWRDWKARSSPLWLPLACALMFILTMSDLTLGLVRAYQAFHVKAGQLADPLTYYLDSRTPLNLTKNVANIVLPLILDAIIVYRTYVIWEMQVKVIAIPAFLVLVNLVFGVLALIALPLGRIQASGLVSSYTLQYYYITTFCLNVICSGLIWWKIWSITSGVFRFSSLSQYWSRGSVMSQVLDVLMQSAAIYCAYLLVLIFSCRTSVFFMFVNPFPAVSMLIFSMLIVRARDTRTASVDHPSFSTTVRFRRDSHCMDIQQTRVHNIDLEAAQGTHNNTHPQ